LGRSSTSILSGPSYIEWTSFPKIRKTKKGTPKKKKKNPKKKKSQTPMRRRRRTSLWLKLRKSRKRKRNPRKRRNPRRLPK
jgi:hypothetical protein